MLTYNLQFIVNTIKSEFGDLVSVIIMTNEIKIFDRTTNELISVIKKRISEVDEQISYAVFCVKNKFESTQITDEFVNLSYASVYEYFFCD